MNCTVHEWSRMFGKFIGNSSVWRGGNPYQICARRKLHMRQLKNGIDRELSSSCLPVSLSLCLSVFQSVGLLLCLSVVLPVCLSVCPSKIRGGATGNGKQRGRWIFLREFLLPCCLRNSLNNFRCVCVRAHQRKRICCAKPVAGRNPRATTQSR